MSNWLSSVRLAYMALSAAASSSDNEGPSTLSSSSSSSSSMSGERGRFVPPETAPRAAAAAAAAMSSAVGAASAMGLARGANSGAAAPGAGAARGLPGLLRWRGGGVGRRRGAGAARGARGYQLATSQKSALKWGSGADPSARAEAVSSRLPEACRRHTERGKARAQRAGTITSRSICEPLCAYLTARGSPVGQHASKQNRDDDRSRRRSAFGCPAGSSSPLSRGV